MVVDYRSMSSVNVAIPDFLFTDRGWPLLLRHLQADLLRPVRVFVWLNVGLYILPIAHIHEARSCKFKDGVRGGANHAGNEMIDPYADHRPQNHAIRYGGDIIPRTNQTAKFARFIEDRATAHAADIAGFDFITGK